MTSWFSVGRPEILEAVVTACGRVDEVIRQDLDSTKQELEQLRNERDENSLQISQLKAENDHLKELLRQAGAMGVQNQIASSAHTPSRIAGEAPLADESHWKSECARVSSKFVALSENFRKAKDALRKRKDERDKWAEYSKLLERKIKAAEEGHGISILEKNSRSNRATMNPDIKAEANPSPNTSFVSDIDAGLDQADLELPPLAAESLSPDQDPDTRLKETTHPLSDSTQSVPETRGSDNLPELPSTDGAYEVQIKQEAPSSSQPVVVSERAVKKRKRDEPELNETPTRIIKTEPHTESSPLVTTVASLLDIQDSIDLGEVAQKIATPRKRRDFEASTRGELVRNAMPDAVLATPMPLYVRADPILQPQTARPSARNSALTPLSVNRRVIQSGGDKPRIQKPVAPPKRGLSHRISSLAEDGGVYKEDVPAGHLKGADQPVPKGRLDALLNTSAMPNDEPLIRSPRPRARANLADSLTIPGRRELPFEREKQPRDNLTNQQPDTASRSSAARSRLPQNTRSPLAHKGSAALLRNKPPSELRLDDFKINPLANEGYDFAYSDVVRDKDSRAELSGCTDMHCCGKNWRAFAISQRPNAPLTPAQRQEEQRLLENYMGNFAYRLSSMSREERDELWVEAKAQELADKHGKHRHRYSRMQSPPGFWNADFPSTQELDTERAEAAKREKQTIQERYREAMRPGGRWIFRDEQE
ncbi:DNA repair protein endonuclease SAE2/CtIP C-terminus-domain-containing protein [Mariannaea sp. PMI_226]|nr:DNA repair protein endonuclease SAE2/CtIP C-terminus-domain-containing protein [Mariannaea sp. PMI_226]